MAEMFTPDQQAHYLGIQGHQDEAGVGSFRDHLQEDGHPLWPVFARAHEWNKKYPGTISSVFGSAAPGSPQGPPRHTEVYRFHEYPRSQILIGHIRNPDTKKYHPGVSITHGGRSYDAPVTRAEAEEIRKWVESYPTGQINDFTPRAREDKRRPAPPHLIEDPEQLARPEETDREALGNALANATKKAHGPHGTVYVSSSVREGSTFNHALSEFLSGPHRQLLANGERMGGSSVPALGTWSDGAEESSVIETPPELTRKLGAVLALKHKQKAFAMFQPGEGDGEQHILEFHRPVPLDNLYKKLLHLGIEYSTLLPDHEDPTKIDGLHVLASKGDGTHEKLKSQFAYFARHIANLGTVEIPSAPTRGEAGKMFQAMLSTDQ